MTGPAEATLPPSKGQAGADPYWGPLELRVVWEEVMKRFRFVEGVGEPVRIRSSFVKGFAELPVRVHPW